ncbi:GNAT family N-acetyltransferase [Phocaeicola dorei]|uniref:GNAT family N-acetyltransferase n=1 Tax=Phocaeicola dorei TaxID=357276 RepID=UPI00068920E0|nr:GNAT family N-acetyltransferase [Phocaeicola dorei]MCE8437052.1 GNAT family N-acetyltransferase [Phocaeicola dorei]MCE8450179.1 GNAT family N-acetyltransferase [Phocaeicola dorei]MCE8821481.1 GNAT family N-acetyltransferase [Phocaeicola dorei]MCE8829846.1 GNAT family N-acetyltransferase [Phocaeicola dorei]QJR61591.1 GNAT family N-acetyltransferase [Phocaeicola dorei]
MNNKKIWDNCRNVFPHPYRLEHAETFIDLIKKKEGIHDFCIEVNGKAVGNIGFIPGTDVECFNAEVGYVIGEKYWNQGIVTDALQEAIYHYFTYTNTIRIFALVFEHNFPSMRVLEKTGFNKVGIMTKSIFKNGHFTNAHLFELLKNT